MGMRTPPTSQLLFDPGPVNLDTLTLAQRRVYDQIGPKGITPHAAGQWAGCTPGYERTRGLQVLRALKRRGLVVERRNPTRYELAHKQSEPLGELPAEF